MVASFNRNPFGVWSVKLFLGPFITKIMTIDDTLLAKEFNQPNPSKKLRSTTNRYCSLMC